jgi:hypothetical protein
MNKLLLLSLFVCISFSANAQYLETFSTPDKGYKLGFIDDFAGVNWTLSPWATGLGERDASDYFNTTVAGKLESIDLDQAIYWESPLLNTVAANPLTIKMDLSWISFDTDATLNNCLTDWIRVEYSVNGGGYVMIPNVHGGNTCATVSYPYENPGTSYDGSFSINLPGVTGGGTLKIRVTLFTSQNAEFATIDNVEVPQAGVFVAGSLPVELVSFESHVMEKDLLLTWRTATETNNAGYDVERSEDGRIFNAINWVAGNGTTTAANDYHYTDKNLEEGKTYYYRLRQVDNNGDFEYSLVLVATTGVNKNIAGDFYPNPTSAGKTSLDFTAREDGEWVVSLSGSIGTIAHQETISMARGLNKLQFGFSALTAGIYIMKLEKGNVRYYRKLVIE